MLSVGVAGLGAWWVGYYTMHFVTHSSVTPSIEQCDYTCIYLLLLACLVGILLAKGWFLWLIVTGRIKKWGALEVENPEQAAAQEQAEHIG